MLAACAADLLFDRSFCVAISDISPGTANQVGARFGAALAAGDFNGDGRTDLAVGSPERSVSGLADAGVVALFQGSTTDMILRGRFLLLEGDIPNQISRPGARFGETLASGDVNGDGIDDLIVYRHQSGDSTLPRVYVLRGNAQLFGSNGGFDTPVTLQSVPAAGVIPPAEAQITLGDANGDGLADLLVQQGGALPASRNLVVALGSASYFDPPRNRDFDAQAGAGAIRSLALGRLNATVGTPGQRGFRIVGNSSAGVDRLALNPLQSDGTIGTPTVSLDAASSCSATLPVGAVFGSGVALGDFDGNGVEDLRIAALGSGRICGVDFSPASGVELQFSRPDSLPLTNQSNSGLGLAMVAWDADGDGVDDLAAAVSSGTGAVRVHARGQGPLLAPGVLSFASFDETVPPTEQLADSLAVGDFNGDGLEDLAIGSPTRSNAAGKVYVRLGTSDELLRDGFESP